MQDSLGWLLFVSGAWFCLLNAYLSFLRYPLHRWRGRPHSSYRSISGVPILGSLFVLLALFQGCGADWVLPIGIILILIDTGGAHWYFFTMIFHVFRDNK